MFRAENKSYNHRRQVIAEAITWSNVPGETPEQKKLFLQQQIADLAATGKYTIEQIYSIVMPNMPTSILYSLPEEVRDQRKQFELLIKEQQAAADVLEAFNGDVGEIIARAVEIFQQQYVPQLASFLPPQRKNESHIQALKSVQKPEHLEQVRKFIQQDRDNALNQIRTRILAARNQLQSQYQIDDVEFIHLLWTESIKSYDNVGHGGFTEKVPNPEDQKTVFNIIKSINVDINNKNKTNLGVIWSGIDTSQEARNLWPTPQPFSKGAVLKELGFSEEKFPRKPSDYFVKDGKEANTAEIFNNPENIQRLKDILEGFMDGNGLGLIFNDGSRMDDFNTYPEKVLFWVWSSYCGRSKQVFASLLTEIGYEHLIENIYKQQAIPDPDYKSMGLNFRSAQEKLIVGVLRQEFGLQAVSYPLEIPVPQGCPTNSQVFVVDFLIPCDVLVGMDEEGHPVVERQVVFVGEYFGFDSSKELEIPEGEVWTMPDGSVATTNQDGQDVELRGGVKTTVGQKYKLRTEWKKMVETAVAEITGNKALHLSRNDLFEASRRKLMSQLDALGIVYNSEKCPANDKTCAVAMHTMIAHLQSGCTKPDCQSRNYVNDSNQAPQIKPVDPIEAYILSAFTDLKMKYAFLPSVTFSDDNRYNRETLWSYIQHRNQLFDSMKALQEKYQALYQEQGESQEVRDVRREIATIRRQYNNLNESPAGEIYNQFQAKINNDISYQRRSESLTKLLEASRNGTLELTPSELRDKIKIILGGQNIAKKTSSFNWKAYVAG